MFIDSMPWWAIVLVSRWTGGGGRKRPLNRKYRSGEEQLGVQAAVPVMWLTQVGSPVTQSRHVQI